MNGATPKRVLIAEDEAIIAEDLAGAVRAMGYEVAGVAANGDAALTLAAESKPDIILMDIMMPGRYDGIEAARVLRASMDIPVVFLTAHTDEDTVHRAKGESIFGYLVKPYSLRDLRIALDLALYKHGMERALRQANARYEAIIAAIPDHIFLLNRSGASVALAARGGTGPHQGIPSDASALVVECVNRAFVSRRPEVFEYDLEVGEERRRYEMRVVPLEGEEFLAIVRDVTDLRPSAKAAASD